MSIILNKEELLESNSELRRSALEILEAGYEAINTEKILREKITFENGVFCVDETGFQCSFYERIFFVGIGKCALEGAKVIEDILGDYLTSGIALDVKAGDLKRIKSKVGTHPYPSESNVSATEEILKMVSGLNEKDLVIVLVSGGGSSLFDLPIENIANEGVSGIETVTEITKELTNKGADIYELNTVRKHLSQTKGGQFAKACFPAQVISLIFSDVLGNDIGMIASGPTVMDTTSVADAQNVLEKYNILPEVFPEKNEINLIETPKDEKYFARVKNILAVSNKDALEAMKTKAEELGFNTIIETEKLSGNASEVGKEFAVRSPKQKTCILFGGETTVRIPQNHGTGGRNQEMALSALLYIKENSVLVCASSDGWDNTDHAGAISDQELFQKAKVAGISPEQFLMHGDSYNFFKKVGDGAIYTGKLESNVSDLYILIYK